MDVPEAVTALLIGAGARFAYLFGSRAAGTHRPDSDADVAVMFERSCGLLAESRLALDLADALAVPRFDLVDLGRAPLRLLGRILDDPVVVHGRDEPARVEFEVLTRGMYVDFPPYQRRHREAYLSRVAREGLGG